MGQLSLRIKNSRLVLQEILKHHGLTHIAVDGAEAVEAVRLALDENEPYDLICLDIMMPNMDGQEALEKIRTLETEKGLSLDRAAKIVMTTALNDVQNVIQSFNNLCDGYLTKPIHKSELLSLLEGFGFVA